MKLLLCCEGHNLLAPCKLRFVPSAVQPNRYSTAD